MSVFRDCAALLLAGLFAAAAAAQGPAVRPEVGKAVQAASELVKAKRAKEAVAKAREAQAVPNRTAHESYLVDHVLGVALAAAGDAAGAARAFESAAGSSAGPEADRRRFLAAAAAQYYAAKEYGKSADLAARYLREGGGD